MEDRKKIEDIAATLRSMVEHETAQVDRRLAWMCQLQGLLFAAFAFAWEKSPKLIGRSLLLAQVQVGLVVERGSGS